MRDPKPPYVCTHEDCERLRVAGREVCRKHTDTRKERATYRCKFDGCNELHLSGGFCREHQEHAVQEEDGRPLPAIIIHKDGRPDDLAGAREWFARRMEILGAEIGAELRNIGRIAHWEQERNSDVEE